MNNAKAKTFIAYINKTDKDSWWIDGNCPFDINSPTILPYENAEQKKTAIAFGKEKAMWDEVDEVYGVVLTISSAPFLILNRAESREIVKKYEEEEAARRTDRCMEMQDKKKRGKKKDSLEAKEKIVVDKSLPVEKISAPKEKNIVKSEKKTNIMKIAGKARFDIEE